LNKFERSTNIFVGFDPRMSGFKSATLIMLLRSNDAENDNADIAFCKLTARVIGKEALKLLQSDVMDVYGMLDIVIRNDDDDDSSVIV
jgi:primosomal replication protein N